MTYFLFFSEHQFCATCAFWVHSFPTVFLFSTYPSPVPVGPRLMSAFCVCSTCRCPSSGLLVQERPPLGRRDWPEPRPWLPLRLYKRLRSLRHTHADILKFYFPIWFLSFGSVCLCFLPQGLGERLVLPRFGLCHN